MQTRNMLTDVRLNMRLTTTPVKCQHIVYFILNQSFSDQSDI